jgi:peptidoglycan L-alanyl-D-glutamate endopeptidase CwlK
MGKAKEFMKANKVWIIALLVCAVVFFFVGKNSKPAQVENKIEEQLRQELKEASAKLVEAELNISKMKSEKTNKTKRLVTNADGSSVLIESESSENLESELVQAKSKAEEYREAVAVLEQKITTEQKIRNSLLFVRMGAIGPIQQNGLPNGKVLKDGHLLGSLSYGAWETIAHIAVYEFDLFLVCGHRSKEEQDLVFNRGFSKVKWPNSKHNSLPSEAMDTCPYPIDWNNLERFRQMYEILNMVAQENGMKIRFGADFNMNGNLKDDKFVDLPHCELIET